MGPPVAIRVATSELAAMEAPAVAMVSPAIVPTRLTTVARILAAARAPSATREEPRIPVDKSPPAVAGAAILVTRPSFGAATAPPVLPETPPVSAVPYVDYF